MEIRTGAIGADRIGMRISPYSAAQGHVADAEMDAMYERLVTELSSIGLAYIHVADHSSMGAPEVSPALKAKIVTAFIRLLQQRSKQDQDSLLGS